MSEPFTHLPDADSIKGMSVDDQIVSIEYEKASGEAFVLSMTMPNAHFLLSLLLELPGADQTLERAREFRRQHPIR